MPEAIAFDGEARRAPQRGVVAGADPLGLRRAIEADAVGNATATIEDGLLAGGAVADNVANLPSGRGLVAATCEYADMVEAGIVEPAKVTRTALQNAASAAGLRLTTEVAIPEQPVFSS